MGCMKYLVHTVFNEIFYETSVEYHLLSSKWELWEPWTLWFFATLFILWGLSCSQLYRLNESTAWNRTWLCQKELQLVES